MTRLTMTDAPFELEYFERIDVNPRLTLLRVGGSPAPDEEALALVVSVDGEDFRTRPLGGSVSVEEGGRWRAAFPVPSERLEGAELSYTLETGETVRPRPRPRRRTLRSPRSRRSPRTSPPSPRPRAPPSPAAAGAGGSSPSSPCSSPWSSP
jgi:hypothetical protein